MGALSLSPLSRFWGVAPLVVRLIVGFIMAAHGYQKLVGGPANFGGVLAQPGVPAPTLMAYVVTIVELVGGILLLIGLLSRWAGLLLTVDLAVAVLLVKVNVGLISAPQTRAGAELDLALIAGFLAIVLLGPGKVSLDHVLGIEPREAAESPSLRAERDRAMA